MADYRETLAQLKQQAAARQAREQEETCKSVMDDVEYYSKEALDAKARGDIDGALHFAEIVNGEEARLQEELAKLPQRQGLSPAKQEFLAKRWDLPLTKERIAVAKGAHTYLTQHLGVADDSEEYFQGMEFYLQPDGYSPPPSPDDLCKATGLDPKTYNRNVQKLLHAKSKGEYRDR